MFVKNKPLFREFIQGLKYPLQTDVDDVGLEVQEEGALWFTQSCHDELLGNTMMACPLTLVRFAHKLFGLYEIGCYLAFSVYGLLQQKMLEQGIFVALSLVGVENK